MKSIRRENNRENRNTRDRNNRNFEDGRSSGMNGFGRRNNRNSNEFRKKPGMFHAVCDKCKKDCQVPFKPSGGKPVLCSECFEKQGNSHNTFNSNKSRESTGISQEQFKSINLKLDKILEILENIQFEEDTEDENSEEE